MVSKATENAYKVFEQWYPSTQTRKAAYTELFAEQFEKFKESDRAAIKGLTDRDIITLGEALERQTMLPINEEQSFGQLGALPTLALDFITAMYGKSVIPYIASEQTIDEVQGLVYFENIYATSTRGNVQNGDILNQAAGVPEVYPQGYAGEMIYGEKAAEGVTATSETFTLAYKPVRQDYVTIHCGDFVGTDNGKGEIIGNGIGGTINYITGEVTLRFVAAPAGEDILVDYATNFELGGMPSINTKFDNKIVKANVYGLQTDTSVIAGWIMQKRFDMNLQERAVNLLQESVLNEVTNDLIAKIELAWENGTRDLTQFDCTVPQGVSMQAHFNSVKYRFGVCRKKMAQRAGIGELTYGLAGADACTFLEQVDDFECFGEAKAFPTVYGILGGKTVIIRCPQLKDSDAIYFGYKDEEAPFKTAAVYAPFMPLVGVQDLPVPTQMLQRRSCVASMAAVDVVVPGFITKFKLTNTVK